MLELQRGHHGQVSGEDAMTDFATASSIYSGKETSMDDWKPDERTVQMLIKELPGTVNSGDRRFVSDALAYRKAVLDKLVSFLPKPDPAKALLDEWRASDAYKSWMNHPGTWPSPGRPMDDCLVRWLIDNDRIK
jgi:hypothetical protein